MRLTGRLGSSAILQELMPPAGPVRVLCFSNLAKTVGHGIILSVMVLYFTGKLGIGVDKVGLALSAGAAIGGVASVPLGHLADTHGPRNVTVALLVLLGVCSAGYAFVHTFAALVVVVGLALMAEAATYAARGALLAGLIAPQERVRAFSYMRSVANVGISIGAAVGGLALYLDSTTAYLVILLSGAGCFVLSGVAYLRVPSVPPARKVADGPRWVALRDRPYVTLALLNAVLLLHTTILTVALPVWISRQTEAPPWTYSAVVVVNTAAVFLLQVRVSKGSEQPAGGGRALRRAGLLVAASCALFAAASGVPATLAVTVLLGGALLHVLGEMLHGAGQWSVSFGLAPEHAQGQYQGLFSISQQLGTVAGPALATFALTHLGSLGWLALGGPILLAGLASPAIVAWAVRSRAGDQQPDVTVTPVA